MIVKGVFLLLVYFSICWVGLSPVRAQDNTDNRAYGKPSADQSAYLQVDSLNKESKYYWHRNPDSSLYYGKKALGLSLAIPYPKGEVEARYHLGVVNRILGDYDKALELYFDGLDVINKHGVGDKAPIYNGIGVVFKFRNEYEKALDYFFEALHAAQNRNGEGSIRNNIGEVYLKTGRYTEALKYCKESLLIRERANDREGMVKSMNNVARTYLQLGKTDSALFLHTLALNQGKELDSKTGEAVSRVGLALVYLKVGKYDSSLFHGFKALSLSKKIGAKNETLESLSLIAKNYKLQKDYQKALAYQDTYIGLKDSVFNEEKAKQINRLQLNREEAKNEALRKANELQALSIANQKNKVVAVTLILVFAFIAILFLAIYLWQKQKSNKLLAVRNTEIEYQNQQLVNLNEEILLQSESINEQKLELEKSNDLKNKLISIISHDIRTPLSGLSSLIDLNKLSLMSVEEFKELIPEVDDQLVRVRDFLDGLLYWAKCQVEGNEVLDQKLFDIDDLVTNNIALYSVQLNEKGIAVNNKVNGRYQVYADEEMINLVIKNLFTNAIKFTNTNGFITFDAHKDNGFVVLGISDTGIGMDEEAIQKLYNPASFKTSKGTSGEQGTGFGFNFCREFVEKNGGEIMIESAVGVGSTFSFTLPEKDS